MKGRG
jgi:hypothetical protein